LPIFQLWRDLIKKGRKNPKLRPIITKVLNDLDYLKALRCEGLEVARSRCQLMGHRSVAVRTR
jgi:hypothetical protein